MRGALAAFEQTPLFSTLRFALRPRAAGRTVAHARRGTRPHAVLLVADELFELSRARQDGHRPARAVHQLSVFQHRCSAERRGACGQRTHRASIAGCATIRTIHDDATAGKFRVPTLRNVAVTGPYMHNGVFRDLGTVLLFYNQYLAINEQNLTNPETGRYWESPKFRTRSTVTSCAPDCRWTMRASGADRVPARAHRSALRTAAAAASRRAMTESQRGVVLALIAGLVWGLAPLYFRWVGAASALEIVLHRVLWSVPMLAIAMTLHAALAAGCAGAARLAEVARADRHGSVDHRELVRVRARREHVATGRGEPRLLHQSAVQCRARRRGAAESGRVRSAGARC